MQTGQQAHLDHRIHDVVDHAVGYGAGALCTQQTRRGRYRGIEKANSLDIGQCPSNSFDLLAQTQSRQPLYTREGCQFGLIGGVEETNRNAVLGV